MAVAESSGRAEKIETPPGRANNIATSDCLPALLCMLMIAAGAIFGLMYMLDLVFPSHYWAA